MCVFPFSNTPHICCPYITGILCRQEAAAAHSLHNVAAAHPLTLAHLHDAVDSHLWGTKGNKNHS